MKINKLVLTNFKGIKDFTLQADGQNVNIYGDNAVGKSTVADAFFFVLFGKDSAGSANFEIKTLKSNGECLHNLNHTVELTLDDTTFTRTYHENYTKTRGSATPEFSGHSTDYFIDGVPVDKKSYDERVSSICPEKTFRLLTDPGYFASINWQDRRRMLMDAFCADITDDVVIATNPALKDLPTILGKHSPDDYKKVVGTKREAINKELKTLPARIDELTKSIPAVVEVAGNAAVIGRQLEDAHRRRAELNAGAGAAQFSIGIADAEAAVLSYEAARRREYDEANSSATLDRNTKQGEIVQLERSYQRLEVEIRADNAKLDRFSAERKTLLEKYAQANAAEYPGDDTCYSCGQALPTDKVEAARGEFNAQKTKNVGTILADGQAIGRQRDALTQSIEAQSLELANLNTQIDTAKRQLAAIKEPAPFAIDTTAMDYAALRNKVTALKREQSEIQSNQGSKVAEIEKEIGELQHTLLEINRSEQIARQRSSIEARITELTEKEAGYAQEYEELSMHLSLLEEFIRAKVSLVTEKINSQFEMAKFKLFDEQVNGGIAECCEITQNGVPWGSLNTGMRMNVGLDIIDTMTRATNSECMPVILDNSESVTAIRPTDGQQIRLIVSAGDKVLRVVLDGDPAERMAMPVAASPAMREPINLTEITTDTEAKKELAGSLF